MSSARILIVEDEAIVSESIKEQLESLGYDVIDQVSSGEDAVVLARRAQPDLILMDIMLSGSMDGVDASQKISERYDIPIVFLSAFSDSATLERAKATQPFGYLVKPFKERELHTTIEVSLQKHQLEQKVKESEQWLSTLLRSIGDAVVATDCEGKIQFVSPVAEQVFQWGLSDVKDDSILQKLEFKGTAQSQTLIGFLDKATKGESTFCSVDQDIEVPLNSGLSIPVDVGVAPIFNTRQRVTGVVWTLRDIRARKAAEAQLTEAQQIMSNLLTPREKEVLQMMVDGSSTKEIAFDLDISPRTVEAHRKNMMEKLQAHDIASLIKQAITHKLAKV